MRGERQQKYRRAVLPYGIWVCADGREVIFNRTYTPIWQRHNSVVTKTDDREWVPWVTQHWFYYDGDLNKHTALCRRLEVVLAAFQDCRDVQRYQRPEYSNAPTLHRRPAEVALR